MKIQTKCPTRTTVEQFVEFVEVGGVRQKNTFEREVTWVHDSETQQIFLHGGKVVFKGPVTNDYYGYLSSFLRPDAHAIENVAASYGVTADSTMEIQLVARLFKRPYHETSENKVANQREGKPREYTHLPSSWRQEVVSEHGSSYPALEEVTIDECVVWSSKNTLEQNALAAQAFAERCAME